MYGRSGLDRFKKAQSSEPFSVTTSTTKNNSLLLSSSSHSQTSTQPVGADVALAVPSSTSLSVPAQPVTQIGGGQSTWQPPDWAIDPRPGVYYLEVLKEGKILDQINLDKRRHIFGRQIPTCDFVLDHSSVSRQHAAVVPHKNGSVYVIDLGSAHGTFVANERLTKNSPMELEVGQSLRFAASTRTYILRKNYAALFPPPISPTEIKLPPSPDPSDEEAIVTYNTFLNRYGLTKSSKRPISTESGPSSSGGGDNELPTKRAAKRIRKIKVAFRDQVGGELVEVVGFSDGADVETEPGPVGVKEGSLVGKYASLIQTTVIPKGKEEPSPKETNTTQKGVTDKLQAVLNKVKNAPRSGIYDDLYGDSFSGKVGSSWAYSSVNSGGREVSSAKDVDPKTVSAFSGKSGDSSARITYDDDDDLFGD